MIKNYVKIILYFVFYVALQILIIDKVYLFRIATPLLYLYVIVKLPVDMTRSRVITVSFLLGLVIDIFSNTAGMHAAACSLAGFLRTPLMYTFSSKNLTESEIPSYQSLGTTAFMKYVLSLVVLHHVTLFFIESISFFDPVFLLLRIVACVFLTVSLIFIVEAFNTEKKKSEN